MSGKTLNRARRDSAKYITAGGFEENITLTTPDGNTVLNTTGWAPKHWLNFDADGGSINTKNAHITIVESKLVEAGYPVRNQAGEIHLRGHKVTAKDSSEVEKHYIITEWKPTETIGLIYCDLGDYELD